MTYLLDTNLLLWSIYEQSRLTTSARAMLLNEQHSFAFSVGSIWEVAIKNAKHPDTFLADARRLRDAILSLDYQELLVTGAHAIRTSTLPFHHRDPFDRLLIAQAIEEDLTLASVDKQLQQYGTRRFLFVG